jgi:hypothetical protein
MLRAKCEVAMETKREEWADTETPDDTAPLADHRARARWPRVDWTINLSHLISIAGAVLAGVWAFQSLAHTVDANQQQSRAALELIGASVNTEIALLRERVKSLEDKQNMRTSERQDADVEIKQSIRDLRQEVSEVRRLVTAHMTTDRR